MILYLYGEAEHMGDNEILFKTNHRVFELETAFGLRASGKGVLTCAYLSKKFVAIRFHEDYTNLRYQTPTGYGEVNLEYNNYEGIIVGGFRGLTKDYIELAPGIKFKTVTSHLLHEPHKAMMVFLREGKFVYSTYLLNNKIKVKEGIL